MTRRESLGLLFSATISAAQNGDFVWERGAPLRELPAAGVSSEFTFTIRLDHALNFDLSGSEGKPVLSFKAETDAQSVSFWTDANTKPLTLLAPAVCFREAGVHDVTLRYTRTKLDLFVDGVLVDEEWPNGSWMGAGQPALRWSGEQAEAVRFYSRAISDSAIVDANGGPGRAARTSAAFFGPTVPVRQFYRPLGFNTSAGDAMPYYHDGRFHVFYLFDRRHHGSKWGLGAHQWAHMSSTDLRHWEHHPFALRIEYEWEASICTGSVYFGNNQWYAFYATRGNDRAERLGMAISGDGVHFQKKLPTPFAEPQAPYRRGPNRDPFVRQRQSGEYQMLVTAELAKPEAAGRGGTLETLTSRDLERWNVEQQPFLTPGYFGHQPECADLFFWKGWYYLLFGQDGATRYRMARQENGPWRTPPSDILDSPQSRVMKAAPFPDDRYIGVSFIPAGRWGGNLIFRELVQTEDGSLGTKAVEEMELPYGRALTSHFLRIAGNVEDRGREILVDGLSGFGAAFTDAKPEIRMDLSLRPSPGVHAYGIALRSNGSYETGIELRLEPSRRRVSWRPVSAGSLEEDPLAAIEDVNGLDTEVRLRVVASGDIVDVCLNDHRTLVHRLQADVAHGSSVCIWALGGSVRARDVSIAPMVSLD